MKQTQHEFTFESTKHKDEVRDIILIKDIEISAFKYMKAHSSNETCDTIVLKPKTEMSLYHNSFIPTANVDIFEMGEGSCIKVNCSPLKGVKIVGLITLIVPLLLLCLGSILMRDLHYLLFLPALVLFEAGGLIISSLIFRLYAKKLFKKII